LTRVKRRPRASLIVIERSDHSASDQQVLLREGAMDRHITHPTKEQVRAYMHQREADRRPPPAPEEIRRQLGWSTHTEPHYQCAGKHTLVFPVKIGQLWLLLSVEWLFRLGGCRT
jgi:hypothetical protein